MVIRGPRVELRGVELTDLKDRILWLNNPEIVHYFTNLASYPLTLSQLERWYQHIQTATHHELHFSVYTNENQHIGGAQLKEVDWRNRSAEMGLFIGERSYWGEGYGTEITSLLIRYAFDTLNMHRIWLRVDHNNVGAIHCYEKNGFKQEGIFRDEVFREGKYHDSIVMSIIQQEWFQRTNV